MHTTGDPSLLLRVLFVDDERQVLDGLRNLLRRERERWDMVFAEGGQAALELVRSRPFDVVVCDMRMPGLDGPTLLAHIKAEFPAVVRVVLSGHADGETVHRALPVAQQYLSKPCSRDTLLHTIERAGAIRRMSDDVAIRALIGGLSALPTNPQVRDRILDAVAAATTAPEVAAIAAEDPALVAKLLQLANWECFGARQPITTIESAIQTLGMKMVLTLLMLSEGMRTMAVDDGLLRKIQSRSVVSARLARRLLNSEGRAEQAFVAALLHDVALLALTSDASMAYLKDALPHTVAQLGAMLLAAWGLPKPIVDAVAHHRSPADSGHLEFDIFGAVHTAVGLVAETLGPDQGESTAYPVDLGYLSALGLRDRLPAWRALAEAEIQTLSRKEA
ncbi:MAG: hypothetical protein QOI66_1340 [Myxococcales bacterium]|nr:hypothetical protein [Myxococcales bacterium]